jgi:hypothetical protein
MEPREIPFAQWPQCMEQFSRIHRGKAARVETTAAEDAVTGANARDLPLVGVTDERAADHQQERIHVVLGGPAEPHVDHVIPRPSKVRLAEWNDGYSALLEIESDEGWQTSVRVGPDEQMLPPGVILDGLA